MSTEREAYIADVEFAVIGGGLAGAAVSYFLAQNHKTGVLLEQEKNIGYHASGRNASLFRQAVKKPHTHELARRSYHILQDLLPHLFTPIGSLLLGKRGDLEDYAYLPEDMCAESLSQSEVLKKWSFLNGCNFEAALWSPRDGVIDTRKLLDFFVDTASANGFSLLCNSEVQRAQVVGSGVKLFTSSGVVKTRYVVNASGAWGAFLGQKLAAADVPLQSWQRHISILENPTWLCAKSPLVWHISDNFYFRYTEEGLLASACDSQLREPRDESVDSAVVKKAYAYLQENIPLTKGLRIKRSWAGQRTFTENGRPLIGWDKKQPWLFWLVGLGGDGVAISTALGEQAARMLCQKSTPVFASSTF